MVLQALKNNNTSIARGTLNKLKFMSKSKPNLLNELEEGN